jgi:DNA-binding NarL/FixJ family response regulator
VGDGRHEPHGAGQGNCKNSPSVEEVIEVLSRHPEWAQIKTKLASKLRSAGVPGESIGEVSDIAIRRILEGKRKGIDPETVKWMLAWNIVTSYIFKNLSESKKRRFRLYHERIGRMGLTPQERRVAFYVVWGFGNKEIAGSIGRSKDTVNKQVQSLRRKLGIRAVGLDDRVRTVLTLLGL